MSEPLRVCLDLTPSEMHDRFGGFTRYGLALLEHLLALPDKDRADIELLVLPRTDGKPVPAHEISVDALLSGPVVPADRHYRQRRHLIGTALRAANVDVFHALHPDSLPWRCGCAVVSSVADLICEVLPEPGGGRWRRVRNFVTHYLRHARPDRLIAISETTRRDLRRVLHVRASRIDVVPLGIDTRRFTPLRTSADRLSTLGRFGLPARYFVAVGSDHYRKNQWRLFEAWRQASDRIPEGLVLVGREIYGKVFSEIAADVVARSLGARVAWLPDVDDDVLPSLYRGATALVAPSLYEGFGMTLLEAMACDTPVAASTAPAHGEVAGDAALYFDPLSPADLSSALVKISSDGALRERLCRLGRDRVQRFTWEACARGTLRVYRKLRTES